MTNREKVIYFVTATNMKTRDEIIDFCDKNDIDYVYFEDIRALFDYYDEDNYKSFSSNIIDIICKDGTLIKILD